MRGLSTRQRQVLDYIEACISEKGYPPSVREIARHLNLASAAGVHKHIKALVKKNYLAKEALLSRSLRVVRPGAGAGALGEPIAAPGEAAEVVELPIAGYVAAGHPIEAIEQGQEHMALPATMLRPGHSHYLLRVRGDSMQEEGILDGDYVIVEARDRAASGEVVVALLNGQEATLKRFYAEGDRVRLQPANAAMSPMIVPAADIAVQGVAVGLWRRF